MDSIPDFMHVGRKLIIEKKVGSSYEEYPSQILDILDNEELVVSGPIIKNSLILIHEGENIDLSFVVEDKGRYNFTVEVIERQNNPIYILRVKKVSKIKKIQKRKFFRLDTDVNIDLYYDKDGKESLEQCVIKDISGGGIRIHCNNKYEPGEEVRLDFNVDGQHIESNAVIKRVEDIESLNHKYFIGVEFIDIGDKNREKIVKHIFEEQRILRNKGMI